MNLDLSQNSCAWCVCVYDGVCSGCSFGLGPPIPSGVERVCLSYLYSGSIYFFPNDLRNPRGLPPTHRTPARPNPTLPILSRPLHHSLGLEIRHVNPVENVQKIMKTAGLELNSDVTYPPTYLPISNTFLMNNTFVIISVVAHGTVTGGCI